MPWVLSRTGAGLAVGFSLAALTLLAACTRDNGTIRLTAPFDEETAIGEVTARWRNTGEARAFAAGTRLRQPEIRFQYRADVRNRLDDRLFVRLTDFQLIGADKLALANDATAVACVLNVGLTEGVLAGDVWVPKSQIDAVRGFTVGHTAVPLGQHGFAKYREWLVQSRPGRTADVDFELAQYAGAPTCMPH